MPFFTNAPPRVQPFFGYRSSEILSISARALRGNVADFNAEGMLRSVRTMLSQFISHEVAGLQVSLTITREDGSELTRTQETDEEGFVHFEIEVDDWPLPPTALWHVGKLEWTGGAGEAECHILAPGADTDLAVISDIDDTIIETGITGSLKAVRRNWKRVLAQMPHQREHVPGVDGFYQALGGGAGQASETRLSATRRPFFYVSSSPWNLFSYLVAFKKSRGLPLGPVMLRDWSLSRETLGSGGHGEHKRASIETILGAFPDMRFALIGDDTQGDLTAYASIAADFPNRIAAIFIRSAGEALSGEEVEAKQAIAEAGVPLWLGSDYQTGEAFLREAGLSADRDAAEIVETVEQVAEAAG
ncbi:App1 family protein [Pontixanthobacter luteolus]|uniref:App1 family protein n=1 Tax=Pontixanthobacter luteolus TaxID=295089 RepID=UPI002302DA2D|nr:phosphatase domain-containing protein [Pontixanthobacter luteolus]